MLLLLVDLINIENLIISFYLFYFIFLNFIIIRTRGTSIWYQNITFIRDRVIILVLCHPLYVKEYFKFIILHFILYFNNKIIIIFLKNKIIKI